MSQKVLHGFAWYSYPDILGVEPDSITDPGHPFASPSRVCVDPLTPPP